MKRISVYIYQGIINNKPIVLLLFFVVSVITVHAQSSPGGDPDASAPIDGGLSLLVASGIGYGVKKIKEKKNKEKTENY